MLVSIDSASCSNSIDERVPIWIWRRLWRRRMSRFSSHLSLSCIRYPYIFYRDAFQQQEVRDPPHLFSSFLSSFSIVGADVEILDLKSFEMYQIRCMLSLRYIPRLYRIRFSESALTMSYLSYGLSVDTILLLFLRHCLDLSSLLLSSRDRTQLLYYLDWWITSLGLACGLLQKGIERVLSLSNPRFVPPSGIWRSSAIPQGSVPGHRHRTKRNVASN